MKKVRIIHIISLLITGFLAQVLFAESGGRFFNVLDYGAIPDGTTRNTEAIHKAVEAARKTGGGTIYFPAGQYLTGPIHCISHLTLFIDAGAVLKFSQDFDDYLPMVLSRWEGTTGMNFSPLIYGYQIQNITIRGQGTLDGQGEPWWDFYGNLRKEDKQFGEVRTQSKWQKIHRDLNKETIIPDSWMWENNNFFRPPFIQFYDCKNITIEGVTLINSPFWTINPELCDNVTVTGVTIINPPESYNTDGINPSSCSNVHISNCHISVGDDCITLKSGRDEDGRRIAKPDENITITNCTMLNGHGGVVIGSEMSGDVRKVTITNCVFDGTDRGIRIKTMRGRGGVVEEIRVSNIVMKNIQLEAIKLNMEYQATPDEPVSERTPVFRNIHISNVTATQTRQAGLLMGLEEMPIENVTFTDIKIDADKGFVVENARNIAFHDVIVSTSNGSVLSADCVENLEIEGVKTLKPEKKTPVIQLTNVKNAFIHGANPLPGTGTYADVRGKSSCDIVFSGNNFYRLEHPVIRSAEVSESALLLPFK